LAVRVEKLKKKSDKPTEGLEARVNVNFKIKIVRSKFKWVLKNCWQQSS